MKACNKRKLHHQLILILAGIFCLVCAPGYTVAEEVSYHWTDENIDVKAFDSINIFRVDLRELTVQEYDDDLEDYDEVPIGRQAVTEIAQEFYDHVKRCLKGTLPFDTSQVIDPSKKSLIIELKLSGNIVQEEQGLLMALIGNTPRLHALSFSCVVKNSRTGQVVLTVDDTREVALKDMSEPFKNAEDLAALSEQLDFWARKLAMIIVRKMM